MILPRVKQIIRRCLISFIELIQRLGKAEENGDEAFFPPRGKGAITVCTESELALVGAGELLRVYSFSTGESDAMTLESDDVSAQVRKSMFASETTFLDRALKSPT